MERDSLHGVNQPLSLYKSHNFKNPMILEPYLPKPNYSFPLSNSSKGLLKAPPLSLFPPLQPPLLPLPAALPCRSSSCPAQAVKVGTRTQKKSRNFSKIKNKNKVGPEKEERETSRRCSETKEAPKNIGGTAYFDEDGKDRVEKLRGGSVVFKISPPPPSSLPLPTFSLRPKGLGCNAVAAGVDAGATDDLRRLLRLQ